MAAPPQEQPWPAMPEQSQSMESMAQFSGAPGKMLGFVSSQSSPSGGAA